MPTYDYGCSSCGKEWEEVQRITAPALEVCPHCGKATAQRLISKGAGFILKGGGWYSDLYSSPKAGSSSGASEGESKASGTGSTSGESKPSGGDSKPSGGDSKPSGGESKPSGSETKSTAPATPTT